MTQLPIPTTPASAPERISMNASVPTPSPAPLRRLSRLAVAALLSGACCCCSNITAQAQASGTIVGWGNNSSLQLQIPPGLNAAIAVAAGSAHSLALKSDGTVVGWG